MSEESVHVCPPFVLYAIDPFELHPTATNLEPSEATARASPPVNGVSVKGVHVTPSGLYTTAEPVPPDCDWASPTATHAAFEK